MSHYNINRETAIKAYSDFMQALGLDIAAEGNQDTPRRVVDYYIEFLTPPEVKYTLFDKEGYDEMIISHNIEFDSLCEHHHLPFSGTAAVAYLPGDGGKIIGLSKLARTVDFFSRRFQNQERITMQVGKTLKEKLGTDSVAVVLRAEHGCMKCRGARKRGSEMVTSYLSGAFKSDESTRKEFLTLISQKSGFLG